MSALTSRAGLQAQARVPPTRDCAEARNPRLMIETREAGNGPARRCTASVLLRSP
jgi:hypothetical protein